MKSKVGTISCSKYPWMISIEEFRKTGDFKDWSDKSIHSAINTLAKLTILTFELQTKKPKK
jgi:hypothetical protein